MSVHARSRATALGRIPEKFNLGSKEVSLISYCRQKRAPQAQIQSVYATTRNPFIPKPKMKWKPCTHTVSVIVKRFAVLSSHHHPLASLQWQKEGGGEIDPDVTIYYCIWGSEATFYSDWLLSWWEREEDTNTSWSSQEKTSFPIKGKHGPASQQWMAVGK